MPDLRRLFVDAVAPQLGAIERLASDGAIACLVWELCAENWMLASVLGWRGEAGAFPLSPPATKRIGSRDAARSAWVERARPDVLRVVVLTGAGMCLLLNLDIDHAARLEVEPSRTISA